MLWRFRKYLLVACGLWLLASSAHAQAPARTTVKDTVYKSDGSLAAGTVVVSWQPFLDSANKPIFGGSQSYTLAGGALGIMLVPNAGATPSGTSYTVRYYQSGSVYAEEFWVVPATSPLASPDAPTVTPQGTPGSTTYCYWITARNAVGETLLSSGTCISNGAATLNGTDYNEVDWPDVSGATSYRVFRNASSTAPSGACPGGTHPACGVVGTPSSSTINDQSSSTSAGTTPSINDTDPKTVADVRVAVAPSPTLVLAASQITGTAIVGSPSSTQTITAPATAGIVPLRVRGNATANANVLEIYDTSLALQSYFTPAGALYTPQATIAHATLGGIVQQISTTATNDDPTKITEQGRAATTTATPGTLQTIAIAASKTYSVRCDVLARRTGGAAGTADDGAAYVIRGAYTTKSGTVTALGTTPVAEFTAEDVSGYDATLVVSGANVLVQVTGVADTNITWHSTCERMAVGS